VRNKPDMFTKYTIWHNVKGLSSYHTNKLSTRPIKILVNTVHKIAL